MPALLILLGVAATIGSPSYGTALLLAFAFGRAVPILIEAVTIAWLENFRILGRYQKAFEVVGAVVLILAGLYMLNAYLFVIPVLAGQAGASRAADRRFEGDVSEPKCSLEDDVSPAFKRACREDDLAVAEHLLRALEVIARRGDAQDRLARAFLLLAQTLPQRRTRFEFVRRDQSREPGLNAIHTWTPTTPYWAIMATSNNRTLP